MTYQGLGGFRRGKQNPSARRVGESDIAYERRLSTFHRQQTTEDDAWAQHRAAVDVPTGTGSGLYGRSTPQDRAAALGRHGFGGEQRPERLGGLGMTATPGQVSIGRVYRDDLRDSKAVSPLMTHLRGNSGTDESWR